MMLRYISLRDMVLQQRPPWRPQVSLKFGSLSGPLEEVQVPKHQTFGPYTPYTCTPRAFARSPRYQKHNSSCFGSRHVVPQPQALNPRANPRPNTRPGLVRATVTANNDQKQRL